MQFTSTSLWKTSTNPIVRAVHLRRFETILNKAIKYSGPKKSALDYGCGDGELVRSCSKYYGFVAGVDIGPSKIEAARHLGIPPNVVFELSTNLDRIVKNVTNGFDVVILSGILEHVSDEVRDTIFRNLTAVIHPATIFIIEVPIESGPVLPLKCVGGWALKIMTHGAYKREGYSVGDLVRRISIKNAPHIRPPHPNGGYYGHKDFSVWNLREFMIRMGFTIVEVRYIPFNPFKLFNLQVCLVCVQRQTLVDGAAR